MQILLLLLEAGLIDIAKGLISMDFFDFRKIILLRNLRLDYLHQCLNRQ